MSRGTRRYSRGLLAGVVLALVIVGQASAQQPLLRPGGWVTDEAGFLSPHEEQSLEALMESYKQGSDNEIALVTVPNLGGRSLEQYALEIGREWGIGTQGRNNGALLFVARQERKVRIEVGRGLEGNLTDSISGRIIRDVIAPDFKRGRFYEGLRAGVEAMHAAAGGDYAKIPDRRRGRKSGRSSGICTLPGILFMIILFNLLRGRGGRGGRGGGGILPWLLVGSMMSSGRRSSGWHGGGGGGGGFGGFGGGGGFSGGGASGGW